MRTCAAALCFAPRPVPTGLERLHVTLPSASRLRIVLAGAGRVGTAVALILKARGHAVVGVASRSAASAERAAARLEADSVELDPLPSCDVVLIGAHDAAIGGIAAMLSRVIAPHTIACHFAGSLGTRVLSPVVEAGGAAAALHPVQACPDVDSALRNLPGSAWGVTTSPGLETWARRLISDDLDGLAVDVDENARPLWHAAAVTTANGIAALLAAGESVMSSIGIQAPDRILGPLAAGTVNNARTGGGGAATLTGPVVRGEADTVARHLDALRVRAPHLVASYSLAARLIVQAARDSGRLEPRAADAIRTLVG